MTRRMIFPLLLGLAGVAILIGLGNWQVRRLAWKTDLIAQIEARMASEPGAVPAAPREAEDEYRRIAARGAIGEGEVHVYTSVPPHGVGYRIIAPLVLEDGRRILIDRGFAPVGEKDAARPIGPARVVGVLHWPDESDSFTPEPDRETNIWLARDVPAMAAALGTEPVMLVISESDPGGAMPLPVTADLRNTHLNYAITWYALAVVWAVMTLALLWRIKRRID